MKADAQIPPIGLGTWELRGEKCTEVVSQALELGYLHIDTAHMYDNHKAIHKAIAPVNRDELFITSKFTLDQVDLKHIEKSIEKSCDLALKELGIDYLDLYLIHWPDHTLPLSEMFQSMQKLVDKKKILKAGVSNFTMHHLEDLLSCGCRPAANQVEFHPYLNQKELLNFCREEQIELIAYRPFGKGNLVEEPVIKEIGKRHKKSVPQVILRWFMQKKIPTIPKGSSLEHLKENIDVFDFSLSNEEMHKIDELNQNKRFCGEDDKELDY